MISSTSKTSVQNVVTIRTSTVSAWGRKLWYISQNGLESSTSVEERVQFRLIENLSRSLYRYWRNCNELYLVLHFSEVDAWYESARNIAELGTISAVCDHTRLLFRHLFDLTQDIQYEAKRSFKQYHENLMLLRKRKVQLTAYYAVIGLLVFLLYQNGFSLYESLTLFLAISVLPTTFLRMVSWMNNERLNVN